MNGPLKQVALFLSISTCFQLTTSQSPLDSDYQVVFPIEVDSTGDVRRPWGQRSHERYRRSLKNESHHDLFLNISGFNQTFHIHLHQKYSLLAPGFRVYHRHGDNDTHYEVHDNDECSYHGYLISHSSKVALSLCSGVTGILRTAEEDFVIEPKPEYFRWDTNSSRDPNTHSYPHIMYKASSHHQKYRDSLASHKIEENISIDHSDIYFNPTRRKRAARPKTIETLVVIDQHVYWKHGRENITTYILSMFNIVSQLFQDDSIGYKIKIVLVGLIILEGEEPGLSIVHNADKTLNSFCQWQSTIGGRHHRQHDHAILLTGLDICAFRDSPCDTLGFAPIKGMCNRLRSCIVTEDSGLSTAFTIAHEIGHNFGMQHDGRNNNCHRNSGTLMSETLSSPTGIFKWSSCSRNYLRRFFNTIQSSCLIDEGRRVAELKFPDQLPGQIFDADTQCKWQFGMSARLCIFDFGRREVCQKLWCYKGGRMCETKFLPAADGTSCGNGMWCMQGKCERYGARGPQPRDGGWSSWSEWGHCSQHCGGGVKKRQRQCNQPIPQYGGRPCTGEDKVYKMCNLQKCHSGSKDSRTQQCEAFNDQPFRGWSYKWTPYRRIYDVAEQCKLYCQAEGYNFFYALSKQVKDGTPCNEYSTDICVQGKCQNVGCDYVVGSSAKNDLCGVCKGDNSTCNVIEGEFTKQPRRNTYFPIVIIPAGASSILLQEKAISSNYLAARSIFGKYFLNGDWHLTSEGAYTMGGAQFVYKRSFMEPESLVSPGPTTEDIVLEILCQGVNPGIHYRYTLPKVMKSPRGPLHNYTWSVKLSPCSQPCAGGTQTSSAHCYRSDGEEVTPQYCKSSTRPKTGVTACNRFHCKPRWFTEDWGKCNKNCGGGHQKRKVICKQKISQSNDRRVPKRLCKSLVRPQRKIACNTQECPPVWHGSKWSECSKTCGKGLKSRTVKCRSRTIKGWVDLPDEMCLHVAKIPKTKGCRHRKCPTKVINQWIVSSWSQCSKTCGSGTKQRKFKCAQRRNAKPWNVVSKRYCAKTSFPNIHLQEKCNDLPCPNISKPYWNVSPWSKCSVSCGKGYQTRLVHCLDEKTQELSTGCNIDAKPISKRMCNSSVCPTPDPSCMDSFRWCELVPKHNICRHHFYGKKCCHSCRKLLDKG